MARDAWLMGTILNSLADIGAEKPHGYLPLYTVRDVLHLDPHALAREAESKGLPTVIVGADECCIKSGALYVFDRAALQRILQSPPATSLSSGWPLSVDQFVARIGGDWVEPTHPVAPVIQRAFGERPSRESE